MDGTVLSDKISRGLGKAALKIGVPTVVYRPDGPGAPTVSRNRVIRLMAAFNAEESGFRRVSGFGRAVWWGVFDAAYTRPGDYLVGPAGTFFIAAQRPLLPVQCVRAERVVTLSRNGPPAPGGYGGAGPPAPLVTAWPASVLETGAHGATAASDHTHLALWTVLLPVSLPASVAAGDFILDDLGRNFVVGAAEASDLGWRLMVRQSAA